MMRVDIFRSFGGAGLRDSFMGRRDRETANNYPVETQLYAVADHLYMSPHPPPPPPFPPKSGIMKLIRDKLLGGKAK
ncbi:hypothetical protein BV898_06902 [Hypsibius exemplaris]|uniref:Uncharacterized protein n=1 Tax=Hypsibius exemplaris TaxID=2072580 RepID=A0A1W0WV64_HYPEX|nr:hypothetical protein BV898_06902 [Hypsibius exemplaris]